MTRFTKVWCLLTRRVIKGFGALSGVCLLALVLVTTADVILRSTIHAPILGVVELTESVMVLIGLSAIGYTQSRKGHISVEIVAERLPGKVRIIFQATGLLLGFLFSGLVVWRTIVRIISIWGQGRKTFLLHIPIELLLAFICIGYGLYFLELIINSLQLLGTKDLEDLG